MEFFLSSHLRDYAYCNPIRGKHILYMLSYLPVSNDFLHCVIHLKVRINNDGGDKIMCPERHCLIFTKYNIEYDFKLTSII